MTEKNIRLSKPTITKHNKPKLTLVWSYSYDPWSGNEVATGSRKFEKVAKIETSKASCCNGVGYSTPAADYGFGKRCQAGCMVEPQPRLDLVHC